MDQYCPCELLTLRQVPSIDTGVTHPCDRYISFLMKWWETNNLISPENSRSHPAISDTGLPSASHPLEENLSCWCHLQIPSCSRLNDGLSWILRSEGTPVIFQPGTLHTNLPKSIPAWASCPPLSKHAWTWHFQRCRNHQHLQQSLPPPPVLKP